MIFATAARYIARRNALQTVYWRTVEDENGVRLVKHAKLCQFKGAAASASLAEHLETLPGNQSAPLQPPTSG